MSTGEIDYKEGKGPVAGETGQQTSDRLVKEQAAKDAAARDIRLQQIREDRQSDIAEGKKLGQDLFGEQKLGRLGVAADQAGLQADVLAKRQAAQAGAGVRTGEMANLLGQAQERAGTAGNRSADIADVIARRKSGLEGFSAEENAAQRASMLQGVGQAESTALRQLRGAQAQAGVRGGLAGAQQMALAQQGAAQRAVGERDLFLRNIAEKQGRLGALEQSVTGAETNEFGRGQQALQFAQQATSGEEGRAFAEKQATLAGLEGTQQSQLAAQQALDQFNLGQQSKEQYGQLASQLGFAQMGAGERSALLESILGEKQLTSAEKQAAMGGK